MTRKHPKPDLRMIPLDTIEVLNPRDRNAQKFEDIVRNIQTIGLKKPITVTSRPGQDGAELPYGSSFTSKQRSSWRPTHVE